MIKQIELSTKFRVRKLTIRTMLAYKRHFPMQWTYCRNYGHVSSIIHCMGLSNPNWYWQNSTASILFVLNSFINKRFITKSSDDKSDLFSTKASVPYSKIGIHLHLIISRVTSSEAILPVFPKQRWRDDRITF